ncbi:hypothetical protein ACFXOD_07735 [Streptomyces sp. NPDC059161]
MDALLVGREGRAQLAGGCVSEAVGGDPTYCPDTSEPKTTRAAPGQARS